MTGHDIVAIGASAGGFEALQRVVGGLPEDLPAAVFVVAHLGRGSTGMLPTHPRPCGAVGSCASRGRRARGARADLRSLPEPPSPPRRRNDTPESRAP